MDIKFCPSFFKIICTITFARYSFHNVNNIINFKLNKEEIYELIDYLAKKLFDKSKRLWLNRYHTTSVSCLLHSIASSNYSAYCVWFSVISYKHCLIMILKRYEYTYSLHICVHSSNLMVIISFYLVYKAKI